MGGQTFSIKDHGVNIFGFVDHTVCDTTAQPYHISIRAVSENLRETLHLQSSGYHLVLNIA